MFNMTVMLGLGGIFAEVFEDVSFRSVPIDISDAESMIENLKFQRILKGFRGIKPNRELIKDILLKVSRLGAENQDMIEQLDLNPVIVRESDAVVVDAKLICQR